MINDILTRAGVLYQHGRFLRMPAETHAIVFDDITSSGADRVPTLSTRGPRILTHDVTVELYEPTPDDATEQAIEAELDAAGVEWSKQDRYWIADAQRYQVIYELSYTEKT